MDHRFFIHHRIHHCFLCFYLLDGSNLVQAEIFSGVLFEHNTCKAVLSPPGQSVTKAEKAQVLTPRNHMQKSFMATSNKEQHSSSSLCLVINSPSRARNTEGHLVDNETSNENFSMYIYATLTKIFLFLNLLSVLATMILFLPFLGPFTDSVELHSGEVLNLPQPGNLHFT